MTQWIMEKQQKKVSNGSTEVDSTKLFALHAVIPTAGQHYRGSDDDEGVASSSETASSHCALCE